MTTIRKRQWKTGKGELRTGWTVDFTDSQGKRQRKQFDSRRKSDDFRIETEGRIRKGIYRPEAARVTVKEAADRFLTHCHARMQREERRRGAIINSTKAMSAIDPKRTSDLGRSESSIGKIFFYYFVIA